MKAIINKVKSIFFSGESKGMFEHDANGELCAVCKKPMSTKQKITKVGSGEKMHTDCWGEFFKSVVSKLSSKHNTN